MKAAQRSRQQQSQTTFQITAQSAHFSGPLPPPEILTGYNSALAGGAERVVAMAEKQSQHRQDLERLVVESNCRTQERGPWLGFIICMTAILGGVYLIHTGDNASGLAAVISALGSLVVIFVLGRRKQGRELTSKSQAIFPQAPQGPNA